MTDVNQNLIIETNSDNDSNSQLSESSSNDSNYDAESTFDDFNFENDELTSDEDDEDDSDEDDEGEEEDDYEDAEFNYDDVKQSIEYVEERYNFFKKVNVNECNLYMLYTENNEVTNVDKHMFELEDDGCVNKEKIVELLQEKRICNDKKYFIKNIWKYNFDLSHDKLIKLFDDDEDHEELDEILEPLTKLSNIKFEKSIDVFKDKNSLYILYSLEKPERKSKKRKSLKKAPNKQKTRKTQKKDKN